ncbi:hypothetical protein Emag_006138 [Eimeria magna]
MAKQEVVQAFQRNIEELTSQNPHAEVRNATLLGSCEKSTYSRRVTRAPAAVTPSCQLPLFSPVSLNGTAKAC